MSGILPLNVPDGLKDVFKVHPDKMKGVTTVHTILFQNLCIQKFFKVYCQNNIPKTKEFSAVAQKYMSIFLKNEEQINLQIQEDITGYDEPDEIGLSNFHVACTLSDFSAADCLLDRIDDICHRVNKDAPVWPGYTPLHFAAESSRVNTVRMLIDRGANLFCKDANGVTPLDICTRSFNRKNFHSILSVIPTWRNITFSDGKTKLMDYINATRDTYHHKIFLKNKIRAGGLVLSRDSPLWPGFTMLHVAIMIIRDADIELIKDIVIQDTDVTAQDIHGSTPIHIAFRQEKWIILEWLLKYLKATENVVDDDKLSYLHIAAFSNHQSVVKKLLRNNDKVNIAYKGRGLSTVKFGWTPLHTAANSKNDLVARQLLKRGADVLVTDYQGFTAIHILFGLTYTNKIAEILLSDMRLKESVIEGLGLSHLHVAAWSNKAKAIERLVDLGASTEVTIGKIDEGPMLKFEGFKPIDVAMMDRSRVAAFAALVRKGADIYERIIDRVSPIIELLTGKYDVGYLKSIASCMSSSIELEERLLNKLGVQAIHIASYALDVASVKQLLQYGVDINARVCEGSAVWPGFTPLHSFTMAVLNYLHSDADDLLELIIGKGADVTFKNIYGDTPVHMALKAARPSDGIILASYLLDGQIDFTLNPLNTGGLSHFHVACLLNKVDIVEKFLKINPNIDINQAVSLNDTALAFAGYTPLHCALSFFAQDFYDEQSQIEVVKLLVKHGVDIHAIDGFGYTPLHLLAAACVTTRHALLPLILIDGLDINTRAADGTTPMEIFLRKAIPIAELEHLLNLGGQINSYNHLSGVGYMSLILTSEEYDRSNQTWRIVNIMMNLANVAQVDGIGRNAIHNAVANLTFGLDFLSYKSEDYFHIIESLIQRGCCIFQQDIRGRTPLHFAVESGNRAAVKALLKSGADVNIVDAVSQSSFGYAWERYLNNTTNLVSNIIICKLFGERVSLLQSVGLQVSNLNARILDTLLEEQHEIEININEDNIKQELQLTEAIVTTEGGIKLRQFLYQTGVVTIYPHLKLEIRTLVQELFLELNHFPEIRGILRLQHRSCLHRLSLIETTAHPVQALELLTGWPLPILCVYSIFKYLTNLDLKNLASVAEL